jgi:hypothetical protein
MVVPEVISTMDSAADLVEVAALHQQKQVQEEQAIKVKMEDLAPATIFVHHQVAVVADFLLLEPLVQNASLETEATDINCHLILTFRFGLRAAHQVAV